MVHKNCISGFWIKHPCQRTILKKNAEIKEEMMKLLRLFRLRGKKFSGAQPEEEEEEEPPSRISRISF
jgi:uncharacterized protein YneF (UPF0154 family)